MTFATKVIFGVEAAFLMWILALCAFILFYGYGAQEAHGESFAVSIAQYGVGGANSLNMQQTKSLFDQVAKKYKPIGIKLTRTKFTWFAHNPISPRMDRAVWSFWWWQKRLPTAHNGVVRWLVSPPWSDSTYGHHWLGGFTLGLCNFRTNPKNLSFSTAENTRYNSTAALDYDILAGVHELGHAFGAPDYGGACGIMNQDALNCLMQKGRWMDWTPFDWFDMPQCLRK